MSEVGDLVKMLGSPLGLIGTIALAAGGLAHHFATAELKNAAGRDRLRTALQAGGYWRRLYIHLLTPALDRLDRFLGDADKAAFSLPSPFGNREAHPYWTGWSFDRCALLALVYPLLSLFFVWVWTGESGPIAELLGMKRGTIWWSRAALAALTAVIAFAYWKALRTKSWHSVLWSVVVLSLVLALSLALALAPFLSHSLSLSLWLAVSLALSLSLALALSLSRGLSLALLNIARAAMPSAGSGWVIGLWYSWSVISASSGWPGLVPGQPLSALC